VPVTPRGIGIQRASTRCRGGRGWTRRAQVALGRRLLGRPVSKSGRLCHGDGGPRTERAPAEGAKLPMLNGRYVAYAPTDFDLLPNDSSRPRPVPRVYI